MWSSTTNDRSSLSMLAMLLLLVVAVGGAAGGLPRALLCPALLPLRARELPDVGFTIVNYKLRLEIVFRLIYYSRHGK